MNNAARLISLLSMIHHFDTGLPEVLRIGPRFLPASWALIYGWLPGWAWWLWPGLYVLTGLVSGIGLFHPRLIRIGLRMGAGINFIWGSVSFYGWVTAQGGTIPGTSTYWFLASVLAVLAYAFSKSDRVSQQVSAGAVEAFQAEDVRKANGATEHG